MSKKKTSLKEAMKVCKGLSLSKKIKLAAKLFGVHNHLGTLPFASMTDNSGQIVIPTNCKYKDQVVKEMTDEDRLGE